MSIGSLHLERYARECKFWNFGGEKQLLAVFFSRLRWSYILHVTIFLIIWLMWPPPPLSRKQILLVRGLVPRLLTFSHTHLNLAWNLSYSLMLKCQQLLACIYKHDTNTTSESLKARTVIVGWSAVVIVVFPDHNHLLFYFTNFISYKELNFNLRLCYMLAWKKVYNPGASLQCYRD